MGYMIVITSDQHINSTIGLCPPQVTLDDGGEYRGSDTQRFLWRSWVDFWSQVEVIKTQTGFPVLSIFNGDAVEIDQRGRSSQLISRNKATTLDIVRSVLEQPVKLSDWLLFTRGTASHTGKSAWTEEIAADYDTTIKTSTGNASWWSWRGRVGSLLLDIRHHARVGSLPWNKSAPLGSLAVRLALSELDTPSRRPHIAIRSHRHMFTDTGLNYPVRVITTPCWQGKPEYINRQDFEMPPDIGGLIVIVGDNDEWQIIPKLYPMPREKIQSLPQPNGSRI